MNDEVKTEVKPFVCTLKIVDGRLEAECPTKEASHDLAELLEKEVTIRVKPGKVTEKHSI